MSNKRTNKTKCNYTPSPNLPSLPSYKKEWDLDGLYYKNENDPQIEKDIVEAERAYKRFASKWRKKDFTKSATLLKQALTDYETLSGLSAGARPSRYFSFRSTLNTNDNVAEKRLALLSKRLRKASDQLVFFTLAIGHISKPDQKKFLKDTSLSHFHYYLARVFLTSAHHLTEAEEKIIRLKGPQSYGMWVDAVEKIVSNRTVSYKGKIIAIPEALETLSLLEGKAKQKLWDLIIPEMEQIGEIAEHEFNAIITDVRSEEELRGYKKPYSSTALSYEDTEQSIENLVHAVSTKGFTLSKKFYKLKAAFHGVDTIHYTAKYDSIGSEPSITFDESLTIARDVFYQVKPQYGEIFDSMLINGQIDVYPRTGKRGGAFMSSQIGLPTHVLLNHVANFKSLETLAHEMGHAVHAERAKTQSPLYQGYSTVIAETASTLFENLLFDAVLEQAPEEQKMILLHDRLARDIATVQRQIAFFNVELEIHETIEREGAMTNAELSDVMYRQLKAYLGPAVSIDPKDGYSYVFVPHLRYGFYVYTYAYGLLMSSLMAKRYKNDPAYIDKIDAFFCAGESADVASIYKIAEIDTTKPDTFSNALEGQAKDIAAFARYVKKIKK